MTDDLRLRRGRGALGFTFFVQGVTFALLVTRIPAIQDRYGISDRLLPVFLAAVPVLAGAASIATEHLVRRVGAATVLRWSQPLVLLALLGVGAGNSLWQVAAALGAFGLAVGALDASMNMLGVSLQRAYGRSIMLGFHAAYSLGGILGASAAWAGAHWHLGLFASYLPTVAVLLPLALAGSRFHLTGQGEGPPCDAPQQEPGGFRPLLPLCLVMACAYIGDSTVSNWSAKYLQDVLGSSEQLATVPYNVYMVTALLGRAVGDAGVRRFGAAAVVRAGTLLAAGGFAVVATAPGPWAGTAGFTLVGLGLCVIVPQTFAAAGRMFPGSSDTAVARLNIFNYVGFLIGSPLVGALGDAWSHRGAMLVPAALVLVTLLHARSFGAEGARYGVPHEQPRVVDVGRGGHGV
ncbi:MFS transporter [Streptomyces sp. BR123]|uniref:MFS transporter n=1 Tax=Streptomyces sp. BR123 TaxID=2749828 RepID=UPI0015C4D6F9|nr:MFS transporter [Streptomyces sp. BR123]NXY98722.1 MFS transporter [Streptomyces sp. BR123]